MRKFARNLILSVEKTTVPASAAAAEASRAPSEPSKPLFFNVLDDRRFVQRMLFTSRPSESVINT